MRVLKPQVWVGVIVHGDSSPSHSKLLLKSDFENKINYLFTFYVFKPPIYTHTKIPQNTNKIHKTQKIPQNTKIPQTQKKNPQNTKNCIKLHFCKSPFYDNLYIVLESHRTWIRVPVRVTSHTSRLQGKTNNGSWQQLVYVGLPITLSRGYSIMASIFL